MSARRHSSNNTNSSWPSRSLSSASEAIFPTRNAGAVPPLLGLQQVAGNTFSMREMTVSWALPVNTLDEAATAATATHSPLVRPEPCLPSQLPANTAATMTTAERTSAAAAAATSCITSNTSPRAGWPERFPAPLSSRTTPRSMHNGASNQFKHAPHDLQQQLQGTSSVEANMFSRRFRASGRRWKGRAATSPRQPLQPTTTNGSFPHAQGLADAVAGATSRSASVSPVGALNSVDAFLSPPTFDPIEHRAQEMISCAYQCARSCHFGTHVPISCTMSSCPDTSDATTLLIAPHQPLLPSAMNGTRRVAVHHSSSLSLSPLLSAQHADGRSSQMPLLSPSDAAVQPAQMDALRNLFQQYIEAQRALKPALRQLHLSPHEPLPPALQEAVLEKVLNFAAQLHPQAPPQLAPAASDGDKGYPLRHRPPSGSSYTDSMTSSTAQAERQKATQRDTPRQRVVQRKCEDVGWDAILPFLADPPVGAHATLRAVGPGSRRRLEQHAWSWMVEEVRAVVCPFIVENGAEMHVRDSYARLDGRERQYVGSVPVARRTPVPVPRHETTPEERRLLDGTVLLDCERQSLLLDRAWREGWLHRRSTSHLLFLSPAFAQPNSLRFLRLNPSRVHVDGVCCDVLRPRRHQPHNAHGTDSNVAVGVAGSPGLGDVHASTVSRAGLTPPVPPLLDGRPAAEFRVTRKLLGDAVSAISRERARSAEVATRPQLSLRLTSLSTTAAARAAQELANSPASTSSLDAPHVMQLGTLHNGDSCSSSGGRGEVVSTQQETPNLFCTPSPHHPCFRHEALPVVVEDVNGATHVFCTRATSMESDMMRGLMRGWLQHHHRLRRQPLYSTAADFLLVGAATQRKSGALAEADDVDYVVCTAIPSAAEAAALHGDATAPSSLRGAHAAEATQHTETAVTIGGDEGKRVMKDTAACPVLLRDVEQLGCVASPASGLQENAHRTAAAARLFHVRLQEWRAKREDVVRRMDTVDPSWLMVGDCRGPLPRPLALHVTEQHLPWLARQLCPDSEGGGLADLQELHLCVAELLLPPGWVSAWQWCLSILRSRRNLLVVSIVADASPSPMAPAAATGEDCMKNVDDSTVVPALECLSDTAAGPIRAQFMEALLDISSLQVLDLHGVTAEAVMQLLQARTSAEAAGGEANQQSFGEVSCVRLARLRDLYVTVRRGHDAGAGPRSTHSGEVFLSAAVFPSLQVFWLDAPRLRRFTFGTSLVLRELHLVSDSVLLCSALRGVEALPFLEVLHVERAVIDDCAFLGDCLALRELLLHACRLSPTLLAASVGGAASGDSGQAEELRGVERAPSLETLSLCYTDEVRQLRNFARCRSLRRVLLTRCNGVSTSSIAGFECLPRLELLALEYTRVSALSHFSKAPALQVLRVDGCKRVLRSSVMGLEMTPHLRELSLQDTNVSTVANFGGGCTALRSLDLSGCRHLDVDGLQGIQALPQLEVLSLSHTPITDVDFLADCMRLTTLYVEGCTGLLPAALEELRSSPVLRRIMANGCTSLTRVGQLGRCRLLEALSVAGAVALTTAGTQGIEHSPHLRFLDLSGTAVHSLRFLARGCRGLRYLSVRGCPLIRSLRELHGVEELPRLRTFNMENLRVTGSLDFLTVSTSLQHVSFSGCAGLTEEDVRALQRSDISTSIP